MNDNYINSGRKNQKMETRNKILSSAQYFLNSGSEFHFEDIAKRSGISRATIYRYFSNIDMLATEAALDISTQNPESICNSLKGIDIPEKVKEVQRYYNKLTLNNEPLFRKYLSNVLSTNNPLHQRGARRKKTLSKVFLDSNIDKVDKEKLANLLTLFMGMEPFIVTKDVCGLNNAESKELLEWGIDLIFKGFFKHDQNQ